MSLSVWNCVFIPAVELLYTALCWTPCVVTREQNEWVISDTAKLLICWRILRRRKKKKRRRLFTSRLLSISNWESDRMQNILLQTLGSTLWPHDNQLMEALFNSVTSSQRQCITQQQSSSLYNTTDSYIYRVTMETTWLFDLPVWEVPIINSPITFIQPMFWHLDRCFTSSSIATENREQRTDLSVSHHYRRTWSTETGITGKHRLVGKKTDKTQTDR